MMDVNNGEIVAMSTQPDFDLNDPFTITDPNLLATLEGKEGDELKEAKSTAQSRMWTNKAISPLLTSIMMAQVRLPGAWVSTASLSALST